MDLLLLFCGRRRVMQVEGYSMWPTLKPKDRVIVRPLNQHSELPAIGSIIVCIHPTAFTVGDQTAELCN